MDKIKLKNACCNYLQKFERYIFVEDIYCDNSIPSDTTITISVIDLQKQIMNDIYYEYRSSWEEPKYRTYDDKLYQQWLQVKEEEGGMTIDRDIRGHSSYYKTVYCSGFKGFSYCIYKYIIDYFINEYCEEDCKENLQYNFENYIYHKSYIAHGYNMGIRCSNGGNPILICTNDNIIKYIDNIQNYSDFVKTIICYCLPNVKRELWYDLWIAYQGYANPEEEKRRKNVVKTFLRKVNNIQLTKEEEELINF